MKPIKAVFLPQICPDCLKKVMNLAAEQEQLKQIVVHCPHHDGLIHAQVSKLDGERIISQWIIQGPLPQKEALQIIHQVSQNTANPLNLHVEGSLN